MIAQHSPLLTKSKAVSPNHRFVIALRSPDGVFETGLRMCPPEKSRDSEASLPRSPFSAVHLVGQVSRKTGKCCVFRRQKGRFSLQFRLRGGEGGIRTLGTGVSPYNGLANRRIRPLCHLSAAGGATVYHVWAGVFSTAEKPSCISIAVLQRLASYLKKADTSSQCRGPSHASASEEFASGCGWMICSPHSVFEDPDQRPALASSPGSTARVQCVQPMLG